MSARKSGVMDAQVRHQEAVHRVMRGAERVVERRRSVERSVVKRLEDEAWVRKWIEREAGRAREKGEGGKWLDGWFGR